MRKKTKTIKTIDIIAFYVIPIIMFMYIINLTIYIHSEIHNKKQLRQEFLITNPTRPEFQTKFIKEEIRNIDKNVENSLNKILALITGAGLGGYAGYRKGSDKKEKEVNQ